MFKSSMPPQPVSIPNDQLSTLRVKERTARVLQLKNEQPESPEILLIYGHHSSIERVYAIALYLQQFGSVTVPDLPGQSYMEPFKRDVYFDAYADYLYDFIQTAFGSKQKLVIVTMSYGFILTTRLLQTYPQLQKRLYCVLSLGSFTHHSQLSFSPLLKLEFRLGSWLLSRRPVAWLAQRYIPNNPKRLRKTVLTLLKKNPKLTLLSGKEREDTIAMEMHLWHGSDIRTHYRTTLGMLFLALPETAIEVPLIDLYTDSDQYINHKSVQRSLGKIYPKLYVYKVDMRTHAPSVIGSVKDVAAMIPKAVEVVLKNPSQLL